MPDPLTDAQLADYARDGFVIARGFFDTEEIDLLRRAEQAAAVSTCQCCCVDGSGCVAG